jgi:hypothetical protein
MRPRITATESPIAEALLAIGPHPFACSLGVRDKFARLETICTDGRHDWHIVPIVSAGSISGYTAILPASS